MNEDKPFLTIEEMSKLYRDFGKKDDPGTYTTDTVGITNLQFFDKEDLVKETKGFNLNKNILDNIVTEDYTVTLKGVPRMVPDCSPATGGPIIEEKEFTTTGIPRTQESATTVSYTNPKKYEIAISITNDKYLDQLIVALVHQGYEVYYNAADKKLCFVDDYGEGVVEISGSPISISGYFATNS